MRCIFCGEDSSSSKSVEHIIPESFGNTTATLEKGVVCDKCNNYFARKVEGPFLNLPEVRLLRQELEIENKAGKVITEYAYPRVGKEYVKQISDDLFLIYTHEDKTEQDLAVDVEEYKKYRDKTDELLLKENKFLSRMLAKMAVEFFVYKLGGGLDLCEYVLTDEIFNNIRKYARCGGDKIWMYNARRIYARDEAYQGDPFSAISWEADLLFLENGEIYFVVAMHGIEYAINMGGSYLDGYKYWLRKNNNRSPLYLRPEEKSKLMKAYRKKISETTEKILVYDFNAEGEEDDK